MKRVIEASNVTKIFNRGLPNEVIAVKNVSINLKKGECAIIRGPSGSGKTTLLSLLAGMTRPTAGKIVLCGKDITKLPEKWLSLHRRENVGIIFQHFNLIPELTAIQNVMIPLLPTGISQKDIRERAYNSLQKVGLEHRTEFKVKLLSGGEQQRVAIARAIVSNPEVIMADEPTSHLDTQLSMEILKIFEELKKEGKSILISTHDPLVIEQKFVDSVYSMRDGFLKMEDS